MARRYGVIAKTVSILGLDPRIDIAKVQTAEGKPDLCVAIDRTSKFAFARLVTKANRVTASAFLVALIKAVRYKNHTILTDNGIQFRHSPRHADGPTSCIIDPATCGQPLAANNLRPTTCGQQLAANNLRMVRGQTPAARAAEPPATVRPSPA